MSKTAGKLRARHRALKAAAAAGAMDFRVVPGERAQLWSHCKDLAEIVLAGRGRFYFAKDLTLPPGTPQRFFEPGNLARFEELKARLDPDGRFETQLSRRLFGERWTVRR